MLFTPVNQIRLTNVATVRYKKGGKRFEVACYKNKVLEWRNKVETDIDNVLQTNTVFVNVSKGIQAKREDLVRAFKTDEIDKICREILEKGQVQVAEKERQQSYDSMFKEVTTMVSTLCVNPDTKRPYAASTIEQALKDAHFSIVPSKSTKVQALEAIKQLKEVIPIERAKMRLRVTVPKNDGKRLKEKMAELTAAVFDEDWGATYEFECELDPGQFRQVEGLVGEVSKGKGTVEVLDLAVQQEGDVALE